MVVVVEQRPSVWAILAIVAVVLIIVGVLLFLITGGRAGVFIVAIPGFPIESILLGFVVGLLLLVAKRRHSS